jgi:hypothetical protein
MRSDSRHTMAVCLPNHYKADKAAAGGTGEVGLVIASVGFQQLTFPTLACWLLINSFL